MSWQPAEVEYGITPHLLDHPVGAGEQHGRHFEAEAVGRFAGFEDMLVGQSPMSEMGLIRVV
jgi:hypothetical protein